MGSSQSTTVNTPSLRLPPHFHLSDHRERCLQQLRGKPSPIERYIFLSALKDRDPLLFYDVLLSNMLEIIPILYTPTVGEACSKYSHIWRRPEGLVISIEDKGHIKDVLRTWPGGADTRLSVVTDGSRILGLGDLGVGGLPISIGKLDLYIAGAGLDPKTVLPICLDVGTNNQKLLYDPMYLGIRQARPDTSVLDGFMEEFMKAMAEVFPKALVQFEDFWTDGAFRYLDQFRGRYRCFNDDIQGTGGVILAGFVNAAKTASSVPGGPEPTKHKILFFGAGSSGIGVAKMLMRYFQVLGFSEEQAKNQIYTVDSKGLVVAGRPGLQEHKKYFARTDYNGPPLTKLVDIVRHVQPTSLIGLSTMRNAFTEDAVRLMAEINPRPIIFPLSNPISQCEVDFSDALNWTNGTVLFASGSPYESTEYNGHLYEPGQGNNMYVFPSLGLGTVVSQAKHVTEEMLVEAAMSLSESLTPEERSAGLMYPRLARIRDVSAVMTTAVMKKAVEQGLAENKKIRKLSDSDLLEYVKAKQWAPNRTSETRARL